MLARRPASMRRRAPPGARLPAGRRGGRHPSCDGTVCPLCPFLAPRSSSVNLLGKSTWQNPIELVPLDFVLDRSGVHDLDVVVIGCLAPGGSGPPPFTPAIDQALARVVSSNSGRLSRRP